MDVRGRASRVISEGLTPAQKDEETTLVLNEASLNIIEWLTEIAFKLIDCPIREAKLPISAEFHRLKCAVLEQFRTDGWGGEALFATIQACSEFQSLAASDRVLREVHETRAKALELVGIKIMDMFKTDDLMKQLVRHYKHPDHSVAVSALEVAIKCKAVDFIADPRVGQCVQDIWTGDIIMADFESAEFFRRRGKRVSLKLLRVPKYQYWVDLSLFFVYLGLYTWVVNNRTAYMTVPEVLLWIFFLGNVLEELREAWKHPTLYFLSLWNWFGIISQIIFEAAFVLRLAGFYTAEPQASELTDLCFDILACNSVIMWSRVLVILSNYEFFGSLLIIMRHMLRDAIMFLAILLAVLLGFAQALHALQNSTRSSGEHASIFEIMDMLFRALFHENQFDRAAAFHPVFGEILLDLYVIVAIILLLNLLIAQFNDTFISMSDKSHRMFLHSYALRAVEYFKLESGFCLMPPFNLIPYLLYPILFWTTKETRARSSTLIGALLFSPVLVLLHLYERFVHLVKRYRTAKQPNWMRLGKEPSLRLAARTVESVHRETSSHGTSLEESVQEQLNGLGDQFTKQQSQLAALLRYFHIEASESSAAGQKGKQGLLKLPSSSSSFEYATFGPT